VADTNESEISMPEVLVIGQPVSISWGKAILGYRVIVLNSFLLSTSDVDKDNVVEKDLFLTNDRTNMPPHNQYPIV